jgi:hypothetical protein
MTDLWHVGLLAVGAGVLTLLGALGFGVYVVLVGIQPRR